MREVGASIGLWHRDGVPSGDNVRLVTSLANASVVELELGLDALEFGVGCADVGCCLVRSVSKFGPVAYFNANLQLTVLLAPLAPMKLLLQ